MTLSYHYAGSRLNWRFNVTEVRVTIEQYQRSIVLSLNQRPYGVMLITVRFNPAGTTFEAALEEQLTEELQSKGYRLVRFEHKQGTIAAEITDLT